MPILDSQLDRKYLGCAYGVAGRSSSEKPGERVGKLVDYGLPDPR